MAELVKLSLMERMEKAAEKLENDSSLQSVDVIPGRRLERKDKKIPPRKNELFVYKRDFVLLATSNS